MTDDFNDRPVRHFLGVTLPVFLYSAVGFGLVLQGVRYLVAEKPMPYHLAVISTPWESLGPELQILLLGLLKGFGAGSAGVGLAIAILALFPLRTGANWSRWALTVVAVTYVGALCYLTNLALLPGATPITVTAVLLCLVVVASVSSFLCRSKLD